MSKDVIVTATAFRCEDHSSSQPRQLGFSVIADNKLQALNIIIKQGLASALGTVRRITKFDLQEEVVISRRGSTAKTAWRADATLDEHTQPLGVTVLAVTKNAARDLCLSYLLQGGRPARPDNKDKIITVNRSSQPMTIRFELQRVITR